MITMASNQIEASFADEALVGVAGCLSLPFLETEFEHAVVQDYLPKKE